MRGDKVILLAMISYIISQLGWHYVDDTAHINLFTILIVFIILHVSWSLISSSYKKRKKKRNEWLFKRR